MGRIVHCALAFQVASVCLAGQSIGILFDFGSPPESTVVELMKSEIRDILAPAHLELSFQRLGDTSTATPFSKIVIVRFHGSCQVQADSSGIQLTAPGILDYPALGRTDVSGGHVLPYVQVYCNEIRAFVPSVSTLSFKQMYGRALARVVVHELYHALLSTRDHSRAGVARFSQSARDLTRTKLSLDADSIFRLRTLYGRKENEGDSEESPSSAKRILVSRTRKLENQPER